MDKKEELKFIVCPVCEGEGRTKDSSACPECGGPGVALIFRGNFIYFGKKLTPLQFLEDKIEKFIRLFLNIVLFIFSMVGALLLVWYIWRYGAVRALRIDFWLEADPILFIFFLSLMGDLYLFYRITIEGRSRQRVKRKIYGDEEAEVPMVPYQWSELRNIPAKLKIDASRSFSAQTLKALEDSFRLAKKLGHQHIGPIHLFAALLPSRGVSAVFGRLGADVHKLKEKIARQLLKLGEKKIKVQYRYPVPSLEMKMALLGAYVESYERREETVEEVEVLVALARQESAVSEILYDMEIEIDKIVNVVQWIRIWELLRKRWEHFKGAAKLKPKNTMDRAMTAVATPFLDRFSQDLTALAASGYLEPCVGRESEIEELLRIMESNLSSVILSGEPGVGKTAIIEGLAQRMVTEEVPGVLQDKRLVNLQVSRLIGGVSPIDAQERLLIIISEIARAGNVILVIEDVEKMIGLTGGGEESLDLSGILADALLRRYVVAIASTRPRHYSEYIESSPLAGALQKVNVLEPEENDAIQILEAKCPAIEAKHRVYFSYDAIEKSVRLADRFMHESFLPKKSIDLIEETAVLVRKKKGFDSIVLGSDVAEIVSGKTHIPASKITEEESDKLMNLEKLIHHRVIGQNEAVNMVASALRRARAELRSMDRPIVNLLFLGPTGVGKTELAKTVAEVYFGKEENMIRFDMSEYQLADSIDRLIGMDGKGGVLTEQVRKDPFSLLLFDEIEKAHPDILNLFLQIMDDGRLTDAAGRTIDFTNVILIATSNAGSRYIQQEVRKGKKAEDIKQGLLEGELQKNFRPEFINRFDGVIVFKPLTEKEIREITMLMLIKVQQRLKEKGIDLRVSDQAIVELAEEGFDPIYGARPLRRLIQEKVDNALAEYLLTGKIKRRDIVVLEGKDKIRVEKSEAL